MFAIEYVHPRLATADDAPWTRLDDCFDTKEEAEEFILLLETDGYGHRYRVVAWDASNDNGDEP